MYIGKRDTANNDPQKVRAAYEAAYDVLFREDIPAVESAVFPKG